MNIFSYKLLHKKILIVGKGPSAGKANVYGDNYLKIGLNHTIDVDISHQVDWNCANYTHPFVVTPYYPLLNNQPHDLQTPDLPNVFRYNLYCSPTQVGVTPMIKGDCASIHYVIRIFSMLGARDFTLCGIDGGKGYHEKFSHITPNPQGYDRQFKYLDHLKGEFQLKLRIL